MVADGLRFARFRPSKRRCDAAGHESPKPAKGKNSWASCGLTGSNVQVQLQQAAFLVPCFLDCKLPALLSRVFSNTHTHTKEKAKTLQGVERKINHE